jgi:hypothetical protein
MLRSSCTEHLLADLTVTCLVIILMEALASCWQVEHSEL